MNTIKIRMQDASKNSHLVGVEKKKARTRTPWVATTMNPVGGWVGSQHATQEQAEAAFVERTRATAATLAAERGQPLESVYQELGLTATGDVPATARPHLVTIEEAPRKRSMCETKMRYDVKLNGELFDTLSFNMRGYIGYLPLPDGERLSLGEVGITQYKKEIGIINREAKAAFDAI